MVWLQYKEMFGKPSQPEGRLFFFCKVYPIFKMSQCPCFPMKSAFKNECNKHSPLISNKQTTLWNAADLCKAPCLVSASQKGKASIAGRGTFELFTSIFYVQVNRFIPVNWKGFCLLTQEIYFPPVYGASVPSLPRTNTCHAKKKSGSDSESTVILRRCRD